MLKMVKTHVYGLQTLQWRYKSMKCRNDKFRGKRAENKIVILILKMFKYGQKHCEWQFSTK